MTQVHSPDFEALVSEAVLDFLRGRAAPAQETTNATVRIPLQVSTDEDLGALVQWLRRLCASDVFRQQFVDGAIDLDIRLATPAGTTAPVDGPETATAKAPPAADRVSATAPQVCDASVITEAALRRLDLRGQMLLVRTDAVVTPSARDYARASGIRLQKGDMP